jgi:hypothetical protein
MKHRRILALLCAVALVAGLLLPGVAASADEVVVYQTAVNDKLLDLNSETMPALVGGSYYVPYTVFDRDVTGVNLGVSYGQWKTDTAHTLTIYSLSGLLTFDVNAGTCTDGSGVSRNLRAILRNGKVYVPVSGVCSFFGLKASYTATPYGTLVRVTSSQAVLSTERFVDAATSLMKQRYNEYVRSLTPAPVVTPASPSPSPSPSVSPTSPAGSEEPDKRDVRLYLAFRCGTGESLDTVLDTLEQYGVHALFCFRTEDLAEHDDQIRRIVGSGHTVGLLVPSYVEEQTAGEYLAEGERLLSRIAHLRPHILMAEESGQGLSGLGLEEQGWALWTPNVEVSSSGRSAAGLAQTILEATDAKRSLAMITMDDSAVSAGALSRLLPQFGADRYRIRLPVETEL